MTIPLHLNTPAFLAMFDKWKTFRMGMKKVKFWDMMWDEQLTMLDRHDEPTAIEMLSQSIRNGWTGIFPLKNKPVEFKKVGSVWDAKMRVEAITLRLRAIHNSPSSWAYQLHPDTAAYVAKIAADKPEGWEAIVQQAKERQLNYIKVGLKDQFAKEVTELKAERARLDSQLLTRST